MDNADFKHPQRFPKNALGPFYTLGDICSDGSWAGQCLSCGVPENEAPSLLAPLTDSNADTYFVRQPESDEEVEQACSAIEVCCVDALRYGGRDPRILLRLRKTGCCDYSLSEDGRTIRVTSQLDASSIQGAASRRWWEFWK